MENTKKEKWEPPKLIDLARAKLGESVLRECGSFPGSGNTGGGGASPGPIIPQSGHKG